VEVLIATAIIGLLLALLLPVLSGLRSKARTVGCVSSLRQVYNGAASFAGDNNNTLPFTFQNPTTLELEFWHYRIADYVLDKTGGTITCPDSPYAAGKQVLSERIPHTVYGMNSDLGYIQNSMTGATVRDTSPPLGRPPRLSDFSAPSQTVLYFDAGSYLIRRAGATQPSPPWGYIPGYSKNLLVNSFYNFNPKVSTDAHKGRHGKLINFVRADGSAGQARPDEFLDTLEYWNLQLTR